MHTYKGIRGFLSDVWTFNPTLHQWTWTGGSDQLDQDSIYGSLFEFSPSYTPGGRHLATAWKLNGSLILFGGETETLKLLNDLWLLGDAPSPPTAATDWQLFD